MKYMYICFEHPAPRRQLRKMQQWQIGHRRSKKLVQRRFGLPSWYLR